MQDAFDWAGLGLFVAAGVVAVVHCLTGHEETGAFLINACLQTVSDRSRK
ncbi:hypothetical protein [Streptomyces similanensis]|uniref:Uncharacterized protein n=1 Tax=Streptomyces similanensis TaxID=1274988 RepID=A0ABP9KI94_9ACTN